ncbi:MAG: hypothetical protein ACHP84_10245 [Caulobacterales bacterium]
MNSRWLLSLIVQAPLGAVVDGVCAKIGLPVTDQVMAAFLVMLSSWGMLAVVLLAIEGVAKRLA